MMKKVHILLSNFREIVNTFDFHRLCLYPVTIFPVGTFCRHLANVDLRVEVCRKRITVVSRITIHNINIIDLIKIVFQCICRKYACHSRVKSTSKKRCDTSLLKSFTICPLPLVFKFCCIFRLIIRCINIVYFCRKTCVHDCQILIWKCKIEYYFRFFFFNQCNQLIYIVSIYLCCCNLCICLSFQFFF